MEELERAKLRDAILSYLLENGSVRQEVVFEALDRPLRSIEAFDDFTLDMFRHYHKYFKMKSVPSKNPSKRISFLEATNKTRGFLGNGGFVGIVSERKRELLEIKKVKKATDKKTLMDARLWWLPYIISGLSFCVAALAYFRPPDNTLQDEINKRLERLEYNQKNLENSLQKDIKSLREELYEAEMLISVYEEKSE